MAAKVRLYHGRKTRPRCVRSERGQRLRRITHVRRATIPRGDFETIERCDVLHDVPKSGQAPNSRRYPKKHYHKQKKLLKGNYSYWNVDTALGVNLLPPRMKPSTRVPSERQAQNAQLTFGIIHNEALLQQLFSTFRLKLTSRSYDSPCHGVHSA